MLNETSKGPAEIIINRLITQTEHIVHNRPGLVTAGKWRPTKIRYTADKAVEVELAKDTWVLATRLTSGTRYQPSGINGEAALALYKDIAEIWRMDNEFAARWASWAFAQEHRDLKVALAAFMLVQSRKGEMVEAGLYDEDYRDVGEALVLSRLDGKDFNPKMLMRVWEFLTLPEIAAYNREIGFGLSSKNPFMGRLVMATTRYIRYRERNKKMLSGLVKAGFRTTLQALCRKVGYKPETEEFFRTLRWKQNQTEAGHRSVGLTMTLDSDSWVKLTEEEICKAIEATRPAWKVIASKVPAQVGITPAIVACSVTSGCISGPDLVMMTPTLEDMGFLKNDNNIKSTWKRALDQAENQRALNIARNVRTVETKQALSDAADKVMTKAVEAATKDIRLYVLVDISGSMESAIEFAKDLTTRLLAGFPVDKLHVATFNTAGSVIQLKGTSRAAVELAFKGKAAGGGTDHSAGLSALKAFKPAENEDALIIVVGDEEEGFDGRGSFVRTCNDIFHPSALALLRAKTSYGANFVRAAASFLKVPFFEINVDIFQSNDPYAVTRTLRHLIESTPVSEAKVQTSVRPPRVSLVDVIMKTELLKKPVWAVSNL